MIQATDDAQFGNYVVTFKVTLDDYPDFPYPDDGSVNQYFTFEFEVVPDCVTSYL